MRFGNLWRAACGARLRLTAGFAAHAQNASPAAVRSPRIYVLDGGVLGSDVSRYGLTPEQVQSVPLSVAAFLIVHPRGVLLWDAGAVPDKERAGAALGANHHLVLADGQERNVALAAPLLAQIAAAGYKPSDITFLALSHYHWDHLANANEFTGATWLARKSTRLHVRRQVRGADSPGDLRALRNARRSLTTDERDQRDGTLIMKTAPGHTPGPRCSTSSSRTRAACCSRETSTTIGRARQAAELRGRRAADPCGARRRRQVHRAHRREALDPARPRRAPQAQEGARVLRLTVCSVAARVVNRRPRHTASDQRFGRMRTRARLPLQTGGAARIGR
jgi:glyoxylase-like metal-dependent hydrolase (beta-lactamase superfamily II)